MVLRKSSCNVIAVRLMPTVCECKLTGRLKDLARPLRGLQNCLRKSVKGQDGSALVPYSIRCSCSVRVSSGRPRASCSSSARGLLPVND